MVIGILIAIQVDNWNEERIAAENTKLLFKEVSDELVQNIKSIDRVIDLYLLKDSLYFKVFNKKVDHNDYKKSRILSVFPLLYRRTSLVDDDFNELISKKNELTELQDSLFSELKDLYGQRKKNTDIDDKTIHDNQLILRGKLKEQPWWFEENTKGIVSDEMIQFWLNDSMYLNELSELQYFEYWHSMGMLWFRSKAMNLHEKITEMLEIEKDTKLFRDFAGLKHLKGVYKMGERKVDIIWNNELKFRWFKLDSTVSSVWDIHPYSDSYLILYRQDLQENGNNFLFRIVFGENERVLGLILHGDFTEVDGKRSMWEKID